MRKLNIISVLLCLILLSCQSQTPTQQWANASLVYNSTLDTLITLRMVGKINDEEYREIEEIRQIASLALGAMEVAAISDGDFESHAKAFNEAMDKLIHIRLEKMEVDDG